MHVRAALALSLVLASAGAAHADEGVKLPLGPDAEVALSGFVEAFYTIDANRPASRDVDRRQFDARSDEFALSNAALAVDARAYGAYARAAVQYGLTPRIYYAREPRFSALQEVYGGYEVPIGDGLRVDAGLFLSPLGLEGLAIKDEWHWSRSNVWTALPTYHLGARATYPLAGRLRLGVYNGWNQIVDLNRYKTLALEWERPLGPGITLTAMYVGGVERETGAPEGSPWRHLLDAFVRMRLAAALEAMVYTDFGFEPNAFGLQGWASYALYLRAHVLEWLHAAVRGDVFFEKVPPGARQIFWSTPTRWIGSVTATLQAEASERISVFLEGRQDEAAVSVYGAEGGLARARTTFTLGVTTWF